MGDDGIQQLHPYPQHPPKSVGDLAAKLIENGLGGWTGRRSNGESSRWDIFG